MKKVLHILIIILGIGLVCFGVYKMINSEDNDKLNDDKAPVTDSNNQEETDKDENQEAPEGYLGVLEEARRDAFRNLVRSVFNAAALENAITGITSGTVEDLDVSEGALTGTWTMQDGEITLTNISDGTYCVASLTSAQRKNNFPVTDDC